MASSVSQNFMGMPAHSANGSVMSPTNSGKSQGSGVKSAPAGPSSRQAPASSAAVASAVMPQGRKPPQQGPKPPGSRQVPPRQPRFSAENPMLGTAPPPAPHPGVMPPFPDARSPAVTMMPNGVPIMPPPHGFLTAGMIPRAPASFAGAPGPATTAQMGTPHAMPAGHAPGIGPMSAPPTMPPISQSPMPLMSNAMQMAHLPPGGMPMPQRPGQTPQVMRRPGMSGLLGR